MKTRHLVFVFPLLLLNYSSFGQEISSNEKEEALRDYKACAKVADTWFFKLDSSDYYQLFTMKVVDFVKIENIKDSIMAYIDRTKKTYGKVNSRKFLGAHIWSGEKLLTYMPEDKFLAHANLQRSEDGFYIVDPKYFGLSSAGQIFSGFPAGRYVLLMYQSVPTIKSYAEELLILRYNTAEKNWEVFTYKISDDI